MDLSTALKSNDNSDTYTLSNQKDSTNYLALNIQCHLTCLLNTRLGMLPHLYDYGLPDLLSLYTELPEAIELLCKAVKKTIEKYEARLTQVDVIPQEDKLQEAVVQLVISGQLNSGQVIMINSYFSGEGRARLSLTS